MSHHRTKRILSSFLATVLVAGFAVASAQAADALRYVAEDQAPIAAEPGAEPFATLYVTTEVEVLAEEGDATQVRVAGVARPADDGSVSEVFTDDTNATRVADVADAAQATVEAGEGDWSEVRLEGWVPTEALADDVQPLFDEAGAIYQENCTQCHAGYAAPVEVLRSTLPNNRVERIVHSMAMGTGLADRDVNLIIQWFQKHPDDL